MMTKCAKMEADKNRNHWRQLSVEKNQKMWLMRPRKIYCPERLYLRGSQGSQKGYMQNMHKMQHSKMVMLSEENWK